VEPLISRSPVAAALLWGSIGLWFLSGMRCLRRAPRGEQRDDRGTAVLVIVVMVSAIAVGYALAVGLRGAVIPNAGWLTLVLGLVLLWTGVAIGEWAAAVLGRFYRPVVAIQENHQVVSAGPYRVVRHPLYSGVLLTMVGIGLAFGNWVSLAVCIVLPLGAYLRRIAVEERVLEAALGDAYRRYAQGRARLVPYVW
jgi:protein-S-isoprenylcysteine O-methyltransferase Ste14